MFAFWLPVSELEIIIVFAISAVWFLGNEMAFSNAQMSYAAVFFLLPGTVWADALFFRRDKTALA